ncbi:MAG: TIGR03435 family protein [Bryobacteraceae bacterium]
MGRITRLVAFGLLGVLPGFGQANSDQAARPEFEVASIKPHTAGDRNMLIRFQPGGLLNVSGMTLKLLMTIAYGVQDYQISGGLSWVGSDRYDIVAKTEDGSNSKVDERLETERLQTLLEDRFKLTLHRETKEMPIYALVIAKGGSKLNESEGECPPQPPGPPPTATRGKMATPNCGSIFFAPNQLSGVKIPLSYIIPVLSRTLGRTVVDKTGLTGRYDIKLEWTPHQGQVQFGPCGPTPPPPPENSGPSIYTALQEQLGLKLESQKGPVEVLVIDHVEQPSEN